MVLVEAQAAGKPVIAGNSGGTAETMKVGNTGMIVDCISPEAIANAVISLKKELEQGAFQPDACRQHVLGNLTWVKHTERAKAVFQQHGGGL